MGMDLLTKKRTVEAQLHNIRGKMLKAKKGKGEKGTVGGGERKKVVELTFYISLTKRLKETLDSRIKAILDAAGGGEGETEIPVSKIGFDKAEKYVALKVYSGGDKPDWTCGGAPDDNPAKMTVKSILVIEDKAFIVMVAQIPFLQAIWVWGGENLDSGECRVEMSPVQMEMDFDAAETEEEE